MKGRTVIDAGLRLLREFFSELHFKCLSAQYVTFRKTPLTQSNLAVMNCLKTFQKGFSVSKYLQIC